MTEQMIPASDVEFFGSVITAMTKSTQSVTRRVEENLQQDAIEARNMVVAILEGLWKVADKVDSARLNAFVDHYTSRAAAKLYFQPFFYETEEYKKRMEDIDNGIFPN